MRASVDVKISLKGRRAFPKECHPIKMGIPFPLGAISDLASLYLIRLEDELEIPCDRTVLLRWHDGSLKWVLIQFLADGTYSEPTFALRMNPQRPFVNFFSKIKVVETESHFSVDTGKAVFTIPRDFCCPISAVEVSEKNILAPNMLPMTLLDSQKTKNRFRIQSSRLIQAGYVSAEIEIQGVWVNESGVVWGNASARLNFFASTALAQMRFTLWNPKAAIHPGGLWDLGDPGSIYFRSLAIPFFFPKDQLSSPLLGVETNSDSFITCRGKGFVHQSSSGFPNWKSLAHVDKHNQITTKFQGYQFSDGVVENKGLHANPVVLHPHAAGWAAICLEKFWQTFPNRLEFETGHLEAQPFPVAENQEFELQGGEKTEFTCWVDFCCDPTSNAESLAIARQPLVPMMDPKWIRASGCVAHLVPRTQSEDPFFTQLTDGLLTGESSLFSLREKFEEWGWRNFGEIPADHEKQHYQGKREFISHYNNQYDWIHSLLRKFLDTGDIRFMELGSDLCRHVQAHDLYHTSQDKPAYNGGYFWHTAHYMHAGTGTHRTYSRRGWESGNAPLGFGGGPSNEHNYTSGLLLHYCLTGDGESLQALMGLAQWVMNIQNGKLTPFRWLSKNPTGLATATRTLDYQGPGRGGGYSINTCLDAYTATEDPKWLQHAESMIAVCIHPDDSAESLELINREERWSYVIFLQILGKYLDLKWKIGALDMEFEFARTTLIRMSQWMSHHEFPYLSKPETLEFPTSTWAAQEMRKAEVFLWAAKFSPAASEKQFLEKAEFFYQASKSELKSFTDQSSVRNMAIILHTLPAIQAWKDSNHWNLGLGNIQESGFPEKKRFIPQKIQAMSRAKIISTLGIWSLFRERKG